MQTKAPSEMSKSEIETEIGEIEGAAGRDEVRYAALFCEYDARQTAPRGAMAGWCNRCHSYCHGDCRG